MPVDNMQQHAFHIVIDDERVKKAFQRLSPEIVRYMHLAMIEALVHVGLQAVKKMPLRSFNFKNMKMGKRKEGAMINIMTGRLGRSLLDAESTYGKESIRKILVAGQEVNMKGSMQQLQSKTAQDVVGMIGSVVPYAAIHEFGGSTGRATMPARPYLGPAIERSEAWIYKNMKAKLQLAIDEINRGGA